MAAVSLFLVHQYGRRDVIWKYQFSEIQTIFLTGKFAHFQRSLWKLKNPGLHIAVKLVVINPRIFVISAYGHGNETDTSALCIVIFNFFGPRPHCWLFKRFHFQMAKTTKYFYEHRLMRFCLKTGICSVFSLIFTLKQWKIKSAFSLVNTLPRFQNNVFTSPHRQECVLESFDRFRTRGKKASKYSRFKLHLWGRGLRARPSLEIFVFAVNQRKENCICNLSTTEILSLPMKITLVK